MPVEDKTLKGQLYNIIYAFSFFFYVSKCVYSVQVVNLYKCISGCRNEEEAGGIMVSYCVKAGRGQILLRLIPVN